MRRPKGDSAGWLHSADLEAHLSAMGHRFVCGVDEVGRGPLAGPVVAAAVILPGDIELNGIDDSKKLSSERREEIYRLIADAQLPCAIGIIDHATIDRVNILRASLLAMRMAVTKLAQKPDCLLIDGIYCIPNLRLPQHAIVGGDARCRSIGAASIVAKVTRDRIMAHYQELYPQFTFSEHKGYPTPRHLAELEEHGPCPIHRKSFAPVAQKIAQYALFER